MRYYIDTEFIEGFHKPFLGKRRHFIDLISIGIVAEDNRIYYAISKEFDPKKADEWVLENVIKPLYQELVKMDWDKCKYINGYTGFSKVFSYSRLKRLLNIYGKTYKQIAHEIQDFTGRQYIEHELGYFVAVWEDKPEFYAYYADYDWVVFCSLFGRMIDLPSGFPMYCRDLKQMMDEKGLDSAWKHSNCPDPEGEHNALIDAKWNKKLYEALKKEDERDIIKN